jgi:hypothetical protein
MGTRTDVMNGVKGIPFCLHSLLSKARVSVCSKANKLVKLCVIKKRSIIRASFAVQCSGLMCIFKMPLAELLAKRKHTHNKKMGEIR